MYIASLGLAVTGDLEGPLPSCWEAMCLGEAMNLFEANVFILSMPAEFTPKS